MASEGSVAPKERVNIRYRPATGDAKEEIELPFKHVVLGDFTLKPDETAVEDRDRINVDKDNFNDVMKGMDLSMDINVNDRLSGEDDAQMPVSLKFDSLKDFEPEQVVSQVPELRKLLELRQVLTALKGPLGNVPAFRKAIQGIMDDDGAKAKLLSELGIGQDGEG
jgi:type VI secretion system protein ImpB